MVRLLHSLALNIRIFLAFALLGAGVELAAQPTCTPNLTSDNLVTNGDFSNGYNSWAYDPVYYSPYTCCWSVPGLIYVGGNPSVFNSAFATFPDHTPGADTNMLMVDGTCTENIVLWEQVVTLPSTPNTNYYFTAFITNLLTSTTNLPTLRFSVNGTPVGPTITPVSTAGVWTPFTANWNSGPTPPATVTLRIINTTTDGCMNGVDFAIDDISFQATCSSLSAGPQPDLGPTVSLCGTGGSITLNTGITPHPNINVTWADGPSGVGLAAPHSRVITAPGTYTVCVDSAGSCVRSDVVTVINSYNIDLGSDIVLCNPITADLDAVFEGTGITYQWLFNGVPISGATSRTYTANAPGTYRVNVTDPGCGTDFDEIVLTTQTATPNNQDFCPPSNPTLSVSGAGVYRWWNGPDTTLATMVQTGPSYTPTGLTGDATFYVQDISTFSANIGPQSHTNPTPYTPTMVTPVNADKGTVNTQLVFSTDRAFRLDSLTIYPWTYWCPGPAPGGGYRVSFEILDASGNHIPGSPTPLRYVWPMGTCFNAQPAPPARVAVGLNIPVGAGYRLRIHTSSELDAIARYDNYTNSGAPPAIRPWRWPTNYLGGDIIFNNTNPAFNLYDRPDAYPSYFDWKITVGTPCGLIPVHATEDCPLPVELVNFSAKPNGTLQAVLNWSTASETNNAYFEVERSLDGQNWTTVGLVSGSGTTTAATNYVYLDNVPEPGLYYYRLNQVDLDGASTLSGVRAVRFDNHGVITLGPNPASPGDPINVMGQSLISVMVYDMLGRQFVSDSHTTGIESFELSTTGWARGMYLVKVVSLSGDSKTFKLLLD